MNGIYFINDRVCLNNLSKQESLTLQELSIQQYMDTHNIQVVRLNPYQLNDYYTIPHALLYDLKKENQDYDCLIYYSQQIVEDFIYSYPAKWLIIKSFFKEMIILEEHLGFTEKKIV